LTGGDAAPVEQRTKTRQLDDREHDPSTPADHQGHPPP
jgi:hypothetical protein